MCSTGSSPAARRAVAGCPSALTLVPTPAPSIVRLTHTTHERGVLAVAPVAKPACATPFALIGDNGAYPWRRKHFLGLVVPEVEDVFSILSLIRSKSFSHVMGLKVQYWCWPSPACMFKHDAIMTSTTHKDQL
ncbi:hypothetical protein FocTR4_00013330 [Fusarium oxysporum f. sp. cubense]|uniref:Uncharacterized protein n=1 Tax=Fusarium oxysporum f. sp. cubense TaxID=61366 RepID=A0A5C6SK94_FUSOC|nr:hypothetical protein FocTR4_00013330 [Fusarium oxysporum f. sp. cubense]